VNNLKGKCGCCEFRNVCMGCRARAFAATGNYLDEEPFCVYEPGTKNAGTKAAESKHAESNHASAHAVAPKHASALIEISH
jgi:sulfatase maturation enzyme AslB (radical SAM superfamily)